MIKSISGICLYLIGCSSWCFFLLSLALNMVNLSVALESEISYVMEPFESISEHWHPQIYNDKGHLNLTITDPEDSLFGDGAVRVEYEVVQTEDWGGFVSFDWLLNGTYPPHNCFGASYLSLWYKILQPQSLPGRVHLRLVLLDDSNCTEDECFETAEKLENYYSFHYVLDGDDNTNNDNAWRELRISLRGDDEDSVSHFQRSGWTGIVGNGMLDLDHIRGWRIELTIDSYPGIKNSISDGIFLLDQLSCVGDGDLFGAAFRTNTPLDDALEDGRWFDYYYKSHLSKNLSSAVMSDASLVLNYTIEQTEDWGGQVAFKHTVPGAAYYNLSQATDISLEYNVLKAASIAGRVHFRLILLDGSDCEDDCYSRSGKNVEQYYSFHHILDDESSTVKSGNITIELEGSNDSSSPFWRTGWVGDVGNNILDSSYVKGFTLELSVNSDGGIGSLVSGMVKLGPTTALLRQNVINNDEEILTLPPNLSGNGTLAPSSQIDWNNDQEICVEEIDLLFVNIADINKKFKKIAFIHNKCCETCQADPDCLYAISNGNDCFTAPKLDPEDISLHNTDITVSKMKVYWSNEATKRGDYCKLCKCNEASRTIDCRGQDLLIIPKTFSPVIDSPNSTHWNPEVLDLRENPHITLLGVGALDSIASSLTDLRLPKEIRYVSPKAIQKLPLLKNIAFEENGMYRGSSLPHTLEEENLGIINVIREQSDFFGNVCCSRGNYAPMLPQNLTFCDLKVDKPGADAVYEPFMKFSNPEMILMSILPSSSFMSEASESSEMCAEYCARTEDCNYFSYDATWKEAEHRCYLLGDNGTIYEINGHPDAYADTNGELPGWISGRPPQTRHTLDKAKVLLSSHDLILDEKNKYSSQYSLTLGSTPLRGAVWIEPVLASPSKTKANVVFSPNRIALYDNIQIATIIVTVLNADALDTGEAIIVANTIKSCDAAYTSFNDIVGENTVYFNVIQNGPEPSYNYIGAVLPIGYAFAVTAIISSLAFACWTLKNRSTQVVKMSQPIFLVMICFGTLVMAASIFPMGIDDRIVNEKRCSIACMMSPWLLTTGFCIIFSALFSKIWRINQIFHHVSYKKIKVTASDVMVPFVILFTMNFVFLLVWTIFDPLVWTRKAIRDQEPWQTYGTCMSTGSVSTAMGTCLALTNFTALALALVQAYQARNVDSDYSESTYIGVAVFSMLQVGIVGVPLVFLIDTNPPAKFFVLAALIFVLCMSMLSLMFVPKIKRLHLARKKRGSTEKTESCYNISGLQNPYKSAIEESMISERARKSYDHGKQIRHLAEVLDREGFDTYHFYHEVGLESFLLDKTSDTMMNSANKAENIESNMVKQAIATFLGNSNMAKQMEESSKFAESLPVDSDEDIDPAIGRNIGKNSKIIDGIHLYTDNVEGFSSDMAEEIGENTPKS